MQLNPEIYDFISLWLAVGVAIYYNRQHRETKMIWRVLRFPGLVISITLWAYVCLRILAQP